MQQSVSSQAWRRLRTLMLAVIATIGVVGLPGVASAMAPAPMLQASPSPTPGPVPVVANISATVTSTFTADVTATVVSNGGVPPIYDRGFLYSFTSNNADPQQGGSGVFPAVSVAGTIGSMTRTLTGLTPGTDYSVNAYAVNPNGTGYTSPAATFTTPCPVITLAPLPNSSVGANYNAYATAIGGSGAGYGYGLVGGTLPPGMTFFPNGLLSGSPITVGTYSFTIGAADIDWNCIGFRGYTMNIEAIDVSPRILTFASQVVGVTSPALDISVINYDPTSSISLGPLTPSTGEFAV